jgi:hypothetical protein
VQAVAALTRLALPLVLSAASAVAEEGPAAIGRISYGPLSPLRGAAICTGVLVAPDLVLTAGHCVRGAVDAPETIRFDAGWSAGRPSGQRVGSAVHLAQGSDDPEGAGLETDVALVVLDRALPTDGFPPLEIADPDGGPFTMVAFDRSAPGQPRPVVLCRPLAKPPRLLALDCPVVSGNSGAPLLRPDGDGWQVVGVMVASAKGGPVRSWAVVPPSELRREIMNREENAGQD